MRLDVIKGVVENRIKMGIVIDVDKDFIKCFLLWYKFKERNDCKVEELNNCYNFVNDKKMNIFV